MLNTKLLTNKLLLVVAAAVIGLFLTLQVINFLSFRALKVTPGNKGKVPTAFTTFKIEFNRQLKLDIDYKKRLDDSAHHVISINVSDKTLTLKTNQPKPDMHYNFSLSEIEAVDGSKINRIEFDFTAVYVPYQKMSKDQQRLVDQQTQEPIDANPILKHLPHGDLNFRLSGGFEEEDEESGQAGNFVLVAELFLSNADVNSGRATTIKQYKQEVLNYIKSLGFDPKDFKIEFRTIDP